MTSTTFQPADSSSPHAHGVLAHGILYPGENHGTYRYPQNSPPGHTAWAPTGDNWVKGKVYRVLAMDGDMQGAIKMPDNSIDQARNLSELEIHVADTHIDPTVPKGIGVAGFVLEPAILCPSVAASFSDPWAFRVTFLNARKIPLGRHNDTTVPPQGFGGPDWMLALRQHLKRNPELHHRISMLFESASATDISPSTIGPAGTATTPQQSRASSDTSPSIVARGEDEADYLDEFSDEDLQNEIDEKFALYETLKPGWDTYSADPLNPKSLSDARRFLEIRPENIRLPLPQLGSDGIVDLYWDTKRGFACVGFEGNGLLSYYAKLPTGGKSFQKFHADDIPYSEGWPKDFIGILEKMRVVGHAGGDCGK